MVKGYEGLSTAARVRKRPRMRGYVLKTMRNLTDVITVVQFGKADARPTALKAGSEGGAMTAMTTTTVFRVEPEPWYARAAKRICQTCVVQVECLEYALANDERFGIWGGMSERERRRLKKRAC